MTVPAFELPAGFESAGERVAGRFAPSAHGHMPEWLDALASLPTLHATRVELGATVTVEGPLAEPDRARLDAALRRLHPWRKGPFTLFGVAIDTEWRSDWKWARVAPHLDSLEGRRVLDVGGGNGYFGWRMLEAGAAEVVGVDPTLVFCMQHRAVCRCMHGAPGHPGAANHVLPLRFEEMPRDVAFDTVFSMGVIYHRRDPAEHIERLWHHTRPGGQVVLESLVVEGARSLRPDGRYARMRNVWLVPTPQRLRSWLDQAGFVDTALVDLTPTSTDEQRSTDWMRFQSLADCLDPARPGLTVEGYPAPVRAVVVGRKPV